VKVDPDVLWVDEGAVLTSAGLAAGIDLCVQLVRADHGSEAAVSVARRMVVAPHRDGGQAQWLERPVPAPGEGLAATCQWDPDHIRQSCHWPPSRPAPDHGASASPTTEG
jgi:transcriptional regulator GlxA family with amidase domain